MVLLTGSANRDERQFPDAGPVRHPPQDRPSPDASATASTSASAPRLARLEGRVALDEVLNRFPTWEVDWDNAVQAHTSTVRGWERLPVLTG